MVNRRRKAFVASGIATIILAAIAVATDYELDPVPRRLWHTPSLTIDLTWAVSGLSSVGLGMTIGRPDGSLLQQLDGWEWQIGPIRITKHYEPPRRTILRRRTAPIAVGTALNVSVVFLSRRPPFMSGGGRSAYRSATQS